MMQLQTNDIDLFTCIGIKFNHQDKLAGHLLEALMCA